MPTVAVAALGFFAASVATAAQSSRFAGEHPAKPVRVHPSIVTQHLEDGRQLVGHELHLHSSLPIKLAMEPGKRADEFLLRSSPKLGRKRLVLPGILKLPLRYREPRGRRKLRLEIYRNGNGSVCVRSLGGSVATVRGFTFAFVDRDHDGALGTDSDGYVVKPRRQQMWHEGDGLVRLRSMHESCVLDGVEHWVTVHPSGLRCSLLTSAPDRSVERSVDYGEGVARLNALRAEIGHGPVSLDEGAQRACELHAEYCAALGTVTHHQDASHGAYSEAGAAAGTESVLTRAPSMIAAIEEWKDTLYHRIDMLRPDLRTVGMGRVGGFACMNVHAGLRLNRFAPFAWPRDGAEDIPTRWNCSEMPDPIHGGTELDLQTARSLGYPISLTFDTTNIRDVEVQLSENGRSVLPAFVSSPSQPANAKIPDNLRSIFITAKRPLHPDTRYDVEVRATVGARPFERSWSFKTATR